MKIIILGSANVSPLSGICLSDFGYDVVYLNKDSKRVNFDKYELVGR